MNDVFLIGKLIEDVNFKFMISKKYTAISAFNIKTVNGEKLRLVAYNTIADFCYRKLNKNDNILISGFLNSNMQVIIKNIKII